MNINPSREAGIASAAMSVPNGAVAAPAKGVTRRWDRVINIALFFTLLLCVLSIRFPVLSNRLYVPNSTFQFGSVNAGKAVSHSFIVYNPHPWRVTINNLAGSCGCTSGVLGRGVPYTLKPFERIRIGAKLNTKYKYAQTTEHITIVTNDNPNGEMLTLTGYVL